MASLLVRSLLLLVCAFAALSSAAAAALGIAEERILAFAALLSLLLLLPFLFRPRLHRPSGPELVLAALVTFILLADLAGSFAPVDAKLALPVLVLLAAPNLARHLPPEALTRFVWRLLSAYVAVTFLYQVAAEPAVVARGYENIVRYDPTGSVVMHSSLSLIHLIMAAARLGTRQSPGARLATLVLGGMSLAMVFMTATRTAFLTLAAFALLQLWSSPQPERALRRLAVPGLAFALAFAGWTLLVNDSLWLRLAGGQGDFSSGRWASIGRWLELAGDHPWGLGLGAIRELLADGRPAIDGEAYLEWPHNEFVRLYVEAGPPGLLFVVLLLALLLRRAVRAARVAADPVRRALILAVAADLLVEACVQNLLNAVYHATVLVLILGLATAGTRRAPAPIPPLAQPALSR